ncbi:dTDP-4-amino-4,6-dideoxygalactose transaminase [Pigmentibacter sp. JX0631]|uniref:dTDP-4-amino-4,6-dideoxygalactose transaminase n=1 Tax=Pigmentibacter sp. JX0631 TaxID=2976982 RepID=UPI00246881F7|nr:dTDP-4-amino-4,6-dideoxygalactose transaminase [Pigmentibacter sp. JX0631]WGL60384.1 dTDP-4-amino-4,6-dideoxygalactose transaminase [Pigmentibacter sp. JX0631]
MHIPLSKPHIPKKVFENINQVFASGKLSGDGTFCHSTEEKLKNILNVKHVLLTSSCTHALEMSMLLLDGKEGDEVILPSFTFTSTANAILVAGLKPVFCEIDPKTFNIDINDVLKKITSKTIAVIPVHYAGVACDMEKLLEICRPRNIKIVEDAAHAIGAKWNNTYLGTIGDMGCLSFHDTKNVICGEGGAFLTNDDSLAEKAMIIREKGTNRSQFLKGQVDKYTWVAKGSSYILAEPLAAILSAEVDIMFELNAKRGIIHHYYYDTLKTLEEKNILTLPFLPNYAETNYHLFYIVLNSQEQRNSLMSHLRNKGIGATFHYIPLHSAPLGIELGNKPNDLTNTEEYHSRLLRLPLYPDMERKDYETVASEIMTWAQKFN